MTSPLDEAATAGCDEEKNAMQSVLKKIRYGLSVDCRTGRTEYICEDYVNQ